MRLLQVCNVGRIVGGTAACAWTVTRALPDWSHAVAFLGPIASDTRAAFTQCDLVEASRVTADLIRSARADVVLLHNTAASRCDSHRTKPTILYVHSAGGSAPADHVVYCSDSLRQACRRAGSVLHQAVPKPSPADSDSRSLRVAPVVGRLCTPTPAKWPASLPEFYGRLAADHPNVEWEFVGCSDAMKSALAAACRTQAVFHSASWEARRHLARWDVLLYSNPSLPETFGRTVAEAMRAGCVPVIDDAGGFREQVTHEESGFLCRTPAEFSSALTTLHDPFLRRRISREAVATADDLFGLARFRSQLLRHLTPR